MFVCKRLIIFWMGHLDNMDLLKDQVRLRAYGQQDPLVEYKREGHRMFKNLLLEIENTIVDSLMKIEKKPEIKIIERSEMKRGDVMKRGEGTKKNVAQEKIGRNDPCPCGSGKKYKKCCGK